MQDYIDDVSKFGRKSELKVLVLKGGIKGVSYSRLIYTSMLLVKRWRR